MSITVNPYLQQKLNVHFFEKNSALLKLIESYNKYTALYTPDHQTPEELQLIVEEHLKSNDFYQNEEIERVILQCLVIQKEMRKTLINIQRAEELGQLKDSFWKNLLSTFDIDSPLAWGLIFTVAGIVSDVFFTGSLAWIGLAPILLIADLLPLILIVIGITLLVIAAVRAYDHQKQAQADYNELFEQPISEHQDNPYSFFDRKKEQLETEIMSLEVPQNIREAFSIK